MIAKVTKVKTLTSRDPKSKIKIKP